MKITEENLIRLTLTMTRQEAQHLLECLDDSHAVSCCYYLSDDMEELYTLLGAFIKESPAEREERLNRHDRLQRLCDQQGAEAVITHPPLY
jgi:hypothetical protein